MDYITCQYDNFWWLALIGEVNLVEKDVACIFMHPLEPTENFYWPVCIFEIQYQALVGNIVSYKKNFSKR